MRTIFAGALALALLVGASPPASAFDLHDRMICSTQPDGAPPLERCAPAVAFHGASHIAVAPVSVASTADAPLELPATDLRVERVPGDILRFGESEVIAARSRAVAPQRRIGVRLARSHRQRPGEVWRGAPFTRG